MLVVKTILLLLGNVNLSSLLKIRAFIPINVGFFWDHIQSSLLTTTNWESVFKIGLIWFTVSIVTWGSINANTGQLTRDYKSIKLANYLRRVGRQLSKEEQRANWWIKKCRFIKWHGQLKLVIPCVGNGSVEQIITKRCDRDLMRWLADNFKGDHWQPMVVKHGSYITWIIVKTK